MAFVVFLMFVGVSAAGAAVGIGRQMIRHKDRSPSRLYLVTSLVALGALAIFGAIVLLVSPFP